jgi:hypothetical protein
MFTLLGVSRAVPPLSTILSVWLQAARSDTRYESEVSGGCTQPDRVKIKWEVSTRTEGEEGRFAVTVLLRRYYAVRLGVAGTSSSE